MTASPIPPARLPAAEVVDSDRNWAPHSDDFGLLRALPMAAAFGLAFYAVVTTLLVLQ